MSSAVPRSDSLPQVWRIGVAAASLAAAQLAVAQVSFTPNPATPLATGWSTSDATPDLHVMVGTYFHNFTQGNRAAHWTAAGEFLQLPLAQGHQSGHATGVSSEGHIVIGWGGLQGGGSGAWRWTELSGMELLPFGEGFSSAQPWAISHDGTVIGGFRGAALSERAVLWTPDGITEIPLPSGYSRGWVAALDASGEAAAGYYSTPTQPFQAYRWTQSGGVETLANAPGWNGAIATEMSDDGTVIAGRTFNSTESRLFRWTQAGGMQVLGELDGATVSDLSADGSVLVGRYQPSDGTDRAFYWSEQTGFIDVMNHLTSSGVDLTGWRLLNAQAVSDDGLTIAGSSRYTDANGVTSARTWTATIPSPPGALLACLVGAGCFRRRRGAAAATLASP